MDNGSPDLKNDGGCWGAANEWLATFGKGGYATNEDWQKVFAGDASITEDILHAGLYAYWAPKFRESGLYHTRYNPPPQMHPVTNQDQAFEQFNAKYTPDCTNKDCFTQVLDAGATGASAVTSACLLAGQLHCAGVATVVGTGLTAWGTGRTVAVAVENPTTANLVDASVAVVTAVAGSAGGAQAKGLVGVGISAFQWGYDYTDFLK